MKLYTKIFIAMILGVLVGAIGGPRMSILEPIGGIFLGLINMIIIPLVLASMVVGVTSIHDPKKLGRVGIRSLLMYLGTTVIAIMLGLLFAYLFKPGAGFLYKVPGHTNLVVETASPSNIFLSLVPSNPFASLASGNILQVIVFAVFLGFAINFTGEKAKPLLDFMEAIAESMYTLTGMIMELSPLAIFAIMANVTGSFGLSVLFPLLKFLTAYFFVCALHVGLVFGSILWFMAKVHPLPFFKGMYDAMLIAFSTCSSSAALPANMHCTQRNLGVSKNITSFILPLGNTVNMNGSAIFQAMAAIFISQVYGIDLSFYSLLMIVITATLSAIGAAGVPGTGFIMLSAVMVSAGLPLEGMAMLAGIDRVREMISTVVNILGDAVVAVYVAKAEGELNEKKYYREENIQFEPQKAQT
jgi:Na+/H+-dicarboxylate symporter